MSAASDALAAGLGALTESVRAACNDPADAIRMLYGLATYEPPPSVSYATPIGQAVYAGTAATAAVRRSRRARQLSTSPASAAACASASISSATLSRIPTALS